MSDAQSRLRERARLFQAQIRKRAAAAGSSGTDAQQATTAPGAEAAPQPVSTSGSVANGVDANSAPPQPLSPPASASHKRDAPLRDDGDDSAVKKQRLSVDGHAALCSSSSSPSMDPLDAFMSGLAGSMTDEERSALVGAPAQQQSAPAAASSPSPSMEQTEPDVAPRSSSPAAASAVASASSELRYFGDEEGAFDEEELDGLSRSESDALLSAASRVKRKELKAVDHASMNYIPIRKDFWIPSRDIAALSQQEVEALRRERLEGVKIRGKNCPRPFLEWSQCGLSVKLLDVIAQSGYSRPFPIQSQAIPVIMSGRDCIACAKTGSGKTLAFVLPLLRHALDQPPLEPGAGPIGLILAPTRELAVQIHYECRRFAKAVALRVVCVYGGSAVAEQIASLKRGSDIIVATPGRLIDMLCANSGRVLSLSRVSYVVLDEADRMFDLGFEPQIGKVLELVRPDRQLVMFSATFPPSVERLARKTLHDGIEIVIGGRSVASDSVTQFVEVRKPEDKFPRLLEILGRQFGNGSIIIFADRQETVDSLFRQLIDASYPCLALHGGMDQADRDTILSDFKSGARSVLIATSVLSRGLDVKDCALVINYSVPNHYEEYVHRVGRTGRAGRKGVAITMIDTEGEEQYAGELVRALRDSGQVVPQDLQRMADDWAQRRRTGQVRYGASDGYGGKGFRFDEAEEAEKKEKERVLRLSSNPDADQQELQDMQDELREKEEAKQKKEAEQHQQQQQQHRTQPSASSSPPPPSAAALSVPLDPVARQLETAKAAALAAALSKIGNASDEKAAQAVKEAREKSEKRASEVAAERARAVAMALSSSRSTAAGGAGGAGAGGGDSGGVAKFSARIEINDYPQQARWAVTKKGSLDDVVGDTGCFITAKGVYVDGQRRQHEGEERLYLLVEGETEVAVMRCRNEIVRRLDESKREQEAKEASQFGMGGGGTAGGGGSGLGGAAGGSRGRYQVVLRLT